MKIVSWDIGIKNLAYCIIENTDISENPYIIHNLDVINSIFNGLISSKESVEKNQIKKTLIGNVMKILTESKSFDNDLSTITLDIGNYLLP